MDDISKDIVRFMDEHKITMATIGGHGYGAKVAAATAISNLNRFTGVIQLEGGPLDHTYYEAYQELTSYIHVAASIKINQLDITQVYKALDEGIPCKKWNSIFKQNINAEGSNLTWKFNVDALDRDTRKYRSETATWDSSYGLWPGQTLAIFAANSRWVHLSTNTLPFYNVFPRLQGQFGNQINIHAGDFHGPLTHWIHEGPTQSEVWLLS